MKPLLLLFLLLVVSFFSGAQTFKSYDQKIIGSSVSFRMLAIKPGKFLMGSKGELAEADESPMKEIEISSFWMGEHEVTFEEWDLYFNDASLPQSKEIDGVTRATPQYIDLTWGMGRDPKHPANSMSQQAAMMYCKWLYTRTGFFYRLPTEAEWEYACKSGTNTQDMDRDVLKSYGHFKDNSSENFHHVKLKKPTSWGLYDMLGNLSEWTIDQYDPKYLASIRGKDPITVPGSRYPRTARGGSYLDDATELRCSNRIPSDAQWNRLDPQIPKSRWWLTDGRFVGFRIVRPFKQPSTAEIEKFYSLYLK